MIKKSIKHDVPYSIKISTELDRAVDKYVSDSRNESPSFSANDLFRLALVKYLKAKGYLQEEKKYL